MFDRPLPKRLAPCLAACALSLCLSTRATAQIIDLSLNVYYDIPSNINSGGTWKLVAKSTNSGIVGLNIGFTGIDSSVVNQAPRGIVNGSDPAGFGFFELLVDKYLITQIPADPDGSEVESAFYGVGTLANGDPGALGPAFPPGSLTSLQGVPWATGDDLVDGPSDWDTAATLLSGTFADNAQPAFASGITGRVFTTIGTSTMYGQADIATITTIIRNNFNPDTALPDYNLDGVVDAADYVAWRKIPAAFGGDPPGYDLWRQHFAEVAPAPAASGQPSSAVPEPSSSLLLFCTVFCSLALRKQAALAAFPRRPFRPSRGK